MQRMKSAFVVLALILLIQPVMAHADQLGEAKEAFYQKNYAKALKLFQPLAEQGDASAQFNMGVIYSEGQGVPQDYAEAVKWYRLAAEQGDASAQYNLGAKYFLGQGVPQDYVTAHKWFNLSAARSPAGKDHDKAVKIRDLLANIMTPAQITKAQRMAREWKPKPPAK